MPQSAQIKGLSDEQRRAVAKEVASTLMVRISRTIPATPVPLVARAALELRCDATEAELAERVRDIRSRLEERGAPTALGREFDPHRAARAALKEDLERNRDLLRLEGEVLATEEAEQIVQLGLERLTQRMMLRIDEGRVRLGKHPHAADLLEYYSRSLAVLDSGAQESVRIERAGG
jgi:hypothetical protein